MHQYKNFVQKTSKYFLAVTIFVAVFLLSIPVSLTAFLSVNAEEIQLDQLSSELGFENITPLILSSEQIDTLKMFENAGEINFDQTYDSLPNSSKIGALEMQDYYTIESLKYLLENYNLDLFEIKSSYKLLGFEKEYYSLYNKNPDNIYSELSLSLQDFINNLLENSTDKNVLDFLNNHSFEEIKQEILERGVFAKSVKVVGDVSNLTQLDTDFKNKVAKTAGIKQTFLLKDDYRSYVDFENLVYQDSLKNGLYNEKSYTNSNPQIYKIKLYNKEKEDVNFKLGEDIFLDVIVFDFDGLSEVGKFIIKGLGEEDIIINLNSGERLASVHNLVLVNSSQTGVLDFQTYDLKLGERTIKTGLELKTETNYLPKIIAADFESFSSEAGFNVFISKQEVCRERQICNPSFKSDFQNWILSKGEWGVSTTESQDGDGKSMYLKNNGETWNAFRQRIDGVFEANKTYQLTVWCKADICSRCGVFFGDANTTTGPSYQNQVGGYSDGNGAWKKIIVELKPTNEEVLDVYLYNNTNNRQTIYYDNLEIKEVESCEDKKVCNPVFEEGFRAWNNTDNVEIIDLNNNNLNLPQLTNSKAFWRNSNTPFDDTTAKAILVKKDTGNSDIFQRIPGIFESGRTYRAHADCISGITGQQTKCNLFFGDSDSGYDNAAGYSFNVGDKWSHVSVTRTLNQNERMSLYVYGGGGDTVYTNIWIEDVTCSELTLCNGDFENGKMYWQTFKNGNEVETTGKDGKGMLVKQDTGNSDIYQHLFGTFKQGDTYKISADCRGIVAKKCAVFIGDSRSEYENTSYNSEDTIGTWQTISTTLTLSKDEELSVYLYGRSGDVVYDNVKLEKIASSTISPASASFDENKKNFGLQTIGVDQAQNINDLYKIQAITADKNPTEKMK